METNLFPRWTSIYDFYSNVLHAMKVKVVIRITQWTKGW